MSKLTQQMLDYIMESPELAKKHATRTASEAKASIRHYFNYAHNLRTMRVKVSYKQKHT